MNLWDLIFQHPCCTNAAKYFSPRPLLNLEEEIPFPLTFTQRPSPRVFWAWRIYSARLCTMIKTADTHDPGAHQSPVRPSTRWRTGPAKVGRGGGTVDSDMQKCLFCSSETSLAYHVSPPARIYIWTLKKHFKRRQQHQRLKKKKSSPPVLAGVFWAEPTAGKPQKNKKINSWSRDIIRPFPSRFHWLKEKYADNV